jgi:hypothetical protein
MRQLLLLLLLLLMMLLLLLLLPCGSDRDPGLEMSPA